MNVFKWVSASRLPVIRQSESSECGLACLAMVAGYYGHETSLAALRRRFNTSLHGMTLKTIVNIADRMGFSNRALKAPIDALSEVRLPAIIHWNLNHFVVLKKVTGNRFIVHDPARGEISHSPDNFSKKYTGVALELTPDADFEQKSDKITLRINELWGSISGLKRGLFQLLFLSLFLQLFVLVSPFFLQTVVDDILLKQNWDFLVVLSIGFGGFAIINALTNVLRGYLVVFIGSNISFQIASNLFKHLLHLPVEYFEKRHMGDVVSRFGSIEPIKKMLTEGLISGVMDGMMAVTTLIMMFLYSPTLALISVLAWGGYFVVRMMLFRTLRDREEAAIEAKAKENSTFMESVRGVTSLKLFGGEYDRHRLWQNQYADNVTSNAQVQKLKIWFETATTGFTGVELVVLVYVAATMVMRAEFTVGMLFAYMAYRTSFTTKASALIERVIEFRMLSLHLERLSDIIYTEKEQDNLGILDEDAQIEGKIEFKNVSYQYSFDTPKILDDMSFTFEAGQSIAIVGPTGCGKTTLLKIMASLFTPNSGEILIDDKPIQHWGYNKFRKQIGVVMQDDALMSGTVSENISFFDPEMDMKNVVEAADKAAILTDIQSFPMRFETLIGDMGAALSGGQKQRLAIARALYRNPRILFMDEGTSNLDVGTEKIINETIANMGITRIVVAHRPETIKSMDRVFVCKGGKLTEVFDEVIYGNTTIQLDKKSKLTGERSKTGEGVVPTPDKETGLHGEDQIKTEIA